MSLMKLSPESGRLRRIVKAYAAGEISMTAYRDIRAEVVEQFENPDFVHIDEDATEQRRTTRKLSRCPTPEKTPSPYQHLFVSIAIVLVVGLAVFGRFLYADESAGQLIPGVNLRDPNPASSIRLDINEIRIDNLELGANSNLSTEIVNTFLADEFSLLQQQDQAKIHGFTERELSELAKFLQSLSVHERKTELASEESQALLELIRDQKYQRGPSLVQLEQVAAKLTDFLRAKGLPLAVAYIPEQTVKQVVVFNVLPGRLEKVAISGGKKGQNTLVQRHFSDLLKRTVFLEEIESALYLVNDLAGVEVQANFVAGGKVGDTDLELTINQQSHWRARARVDNYGDRQTGHQRVMALVDWNNPAGRGDRLSTAILQSFNPAQNVHAYAEYQTPIFDLATTLNIGLSNSDFDFNDTDDRLDGGSRFARVAVKRVMHRSRKHSWNLQLGTALQSLKLDADSGESVEDQKLWYAMGAFENEFLSDVYKTRSNIRFELDLGRAKNSAPGVQNKTFWRARLDSQLQKLITLPGFTGQQELGFSLLAQLAGSALPASLEMGLGGENRVRGFKRSDFSADSGLFLGSELRVFPEQKQYGALLLLADVAFGSKKYLGNAERVNGRVSSLGLGWDISLLSGQLNGKLRWSFPLASSNSIERKGSRIFWSMEYQIK